MYLDQETGLAPKRRGRPSGYRPEACDRLVMLMASGLSLEGAAGAMGFGVATLRRWRDAHPEFREAILMGQCARTLFLECRLLETKSMTVVRLCMLALVNAAPHEWRRKRVIEQAG